MSIFSRDKTWNIFCQHYITHCCTSSSKLWRFFSSFCSTAFQYQSFEKNTKGLDMELIRLLGNYELEVKNVLLVPFAIASFFFTAILSSLFVPLRVWNCSVKTHRSMKFIWHWSRPFFPSFVSSSFKNYKELKEAMSCTLGSVSFLIQLE